VPPRFSVKTDLTLGVNASKKKQVQTTKSSNPIGLKNKIFKPTTQQPYSAEHWEKVFSFFLAFPLILENSHKMYQTLLHI
jgi:hypothetical protein